MKNLLIALVVICIVFINDFACGQVRFDKKVNYPINGTLTDHLTVGDFNNDDKVDVAVATDSYQSNPNVNSNYKLLIYLQDQTDSLKLTDVYTYGNTYGVSAISSGDVNNDGLTDIVIGYKDQICIYYQNSCGKFNPQINFYAGRSVDAIKIGDVDDDGKNDIVVSLWNQSNIVVFYSDNLGCLSLPYLYPSTQSGYDDLEIAKLGSDSFNSIIKMNGQGFEPHISVYHIRKDRGIETLTFMNLIPNQTNPSSIVVGNVSSDYRNELVYSTSGLINVWGFSSDNSFFIKTQCNPGALAVGDLNSDGYDDIVMISSSRVQVIVNKVLYTFYTNSPNNNAPDAIAVADVNSDGKPDIVSVNSYTGLTILINTTGFIPTGIESINSSDVKIFPNPCVDVLNIDNTKAGEILTIYDSTSRIIKKLECNSNRTIVNTQTLTPGIYFVNMPGKNFKFIKKS